MIKKFERLIENNLNKIESGSLADYIPELSKANKRDVGFYLIDSDGNEIKYGEWNKRFTMQSVSKVITLIFAIKHIGESKVFNHIGMEQTADAFNSITKLETTGTGKPLNPLINAGAIATTSLIYDKFGSISMHKLIEFMQDMTNDEHIQYNKDVFLSERSTGHINRSLAYFQKGHGNINGDVNEVLDIYFKMCSLSINCEILGKIGLILAHDGINPITGVEFFSKRTAKITKAIMTTCGLYDNSGSFAVKVGLPSKSGVGGGIMSCSKNKVGIGTFGPSLDKHGNSIAGTLMLEYISEELDLNIF